MKTQHYIQFVLIIFSLFIGCFFYYQNKRFESKELAEVAEPTVAGTVSQQSSAIVNTGKNPNEAYNMLHVVFEGNPDVDIIKKLMKAVLDKYGLEENYEILNRTGSALLALRQSSAVGVTEMDILKHMYQQGSPQQSFPNQAAISATILEQYK